METMRKVKAVNFITDNKWSVSVSIEFHVNEVYKNVVYDDINWITDKLIEWFCKDTLYYTNELKKLLSKKQKTNLKGLPS